MNKIRIIFVVTFIKNVGVYNVVSNIVSNLSKEKYDIYIVSCMKDNDQKEIQKLKKIGIHYFCLNFKSKLSALFFGKNKIKKIIDAIEPQIIHSHAILADSIVAELPNKYKKISTIHCNLREDYQFHFGINKSKFILKFHISKLKKMDKIVGCSKSVKKSLNEFFDSPECVVNCLNTTQLKNKNNRIELRKKLNIDVNDYVYIYIGSLSERKNVIEMINKFNLNSKNNEHLILIGSGSLYDECLSISNNKIHILGQIDEPGDYLYASDIYVSFSKTEGMPLSVIEALSCGLYLFLSDIESHNEIFEICNGEYVGEVFNEDNFRIKLEKIRETYESTYKKRIIRIKENYFGIQNMIKRYCDIYEE